MSAGTSPSVPNVSLLSLHLPRVDPFGIVGVGHLHALHATLELVLDCPVLTVQALVRVLPFLVIEHAVDARLMERLHVGKTGTHGRVHGAVVNPDAEAGGAQKR